MEWMSNKNENQLIHLFWQFSLRTSEQFVFRHKWHVKWIVWNTNATLIPENKSSSNSRERQKTWMIDWYWNDFQLLIVMIYQWPCYVSIHQIAVYRFNRNRRKYTVHQSVRTVEFRWKICQSFVTIVVHSTAVVHINSTQYIKRFKFKYIERHTSTPKI